MNAPQQSWPTTLPLAKIIKGDNPRRYFDPQKHEEMVTSIRERGGLITPPLLRPARDREGIFQLVAGERRFRACLEVYGADGEIPVIIRDMTDREALEAAIDENDVRDDASETEQADAAVRHLAACQNDRAEAARRIGWSRAKLERRLALAELSDTVKHALDERRIKVGHAELLAAAPRDKQDKALETILSRKLDVNETRKALMLLTQNLAAACFDKAECASCQFNSATQRVLFETHVDDGYCTNAGCFQLKTEAAEMIRFEEEERAAKAARAAARQAEDGQQDAVAPSNDRPELAIGDAPAATASDTLAPAPSSSAAKSTSPTQKPAVTAKSIAARTADLREATWRTALARVLAANPSHARTTILVAAMSGTLSQIKSNTLTSRAGLLVDASFPDLGYSAKTAAIAALPELQAANVLSAIGAAYAKDVVNFAHVADLSRIFEVDLRDNWQVNRTFLERFTKAELKFIAKECGLIDHMGEKAFAKRLGSTRPELITSMLNAIGFQWAGRLPSAMTLDGQYGPPPVGAAPQSEPRIAELAA